MSQEMFHVTVRIQNKNYKTLMDSEAIGDISARGIQSEYIKELSKQKPFSDAKGDFTRPVDIAVHGKLSDEEMEQINQV